ncbi:MAG: hypothetical protein ACXABY_02315 [Candidatus Thorarchaeota archaeon]|jgi:hypothetical protein
MKVLIQWAVNGPTDWEEIDSADWAALPKKRDPWGGEKITATPGWVNRLCVQGVEFTADHYAVEDLPGSGCKVYIWSDDPVDYPEGYKNALVCQFLYLDHDPLLNGAINTRQTTILYFQDTLKNLMPTRIQGGHVKHWDEFIPPDEAITRHGVLLPDKLYEKHENIRRIAGWREWTEGLHPSELDSNGHVRQQRGQGRFIVPDGTRTYYHNNVTLATSLHAVRAADERELGTSPAGAASVVSANLGGGSDFEAFVANTPTNEPDNATWPSGVYRYQIDCTAVGANITYGLLDLGGSNGHFGRVNSALTTEVDSHPQGDPAFVNTGLKLAAYTGVWSGSTQSDRFEVLIAGIRPANHGNQTITLQLGETDDFADGPWVAAVAAADNAPLFGMNF